MQQNSKKVFNQSSLLELGVIPNDDIQVLMQVTQRLINEKLFKYVQAEGLGWKLRTLEEAKKFVDLFPNLIPISC
jgi:DNA-directed RNA polymerase III subunit RPC6